MTVYAKLILEAIGAGMRLRVPHDGGPASLVHAFSDFKPKDAVAPPFHGDHGSIGPLAFEPVTELLTGGMLWKLAERRTHDDQRMGWREKGLDGTKADFYCMCQ
jgi:hypothetical protein